MPVWAVVDAQGVPQPGSVQPTELRAIVAFVAAMKQKSESAPEWPGWRDSGYACKPFALERAPESEQEVAPSGNYPRDERSTRKRSEGKKGT
ncbi:MAG TPA: hypothetical protein VGN57_17760 [Pirellulaceae bacterium]|jgi:hypothetical protein|nr:hypothetical protein [Pirellulaceae bacterium]